MIASPSNVAAYLPANALRQPGSPAVVLPGPDGGRPGSLLLTAAELDAETEAWAERLVGCGVSAGDRVLVLVRPGLPLVAVVFALFRVAAVPVVIDPGMGRRRFLDCVRATRPVAIVGVPEALLLSRIFRSSFASVGIRVRVPGSRRARLTRPGAVPGGARVAATDADDLAAILFTSGSTGRAKGVSYRHRHFAAQVEAVRSAYRIVPGEVDLTLLPLFALFNPALGMTTVVPDVNPRRPATLDPARVARTLKEFRVTNAFGAPPLWERIAAWCEASGTGFPDLKRVLLAGAPVPVPLIRRLRRLLPSGDAHTPYGATEALPVASACGEELETTGVAHASGAGVCVGRPVAPMRVSIVRPSTGRLGVEAVERPLVAGEVGEVVVSGPVVTDAYDGLPEATERAKVWSVGADGRPVVWHRMGDLGYVDADGRLWFVGRVAERVETAAGPLDTERAEPVFNVHAEVARTALVGLGEIPRQEPVLVVEPRRGFRIRDRAERERLARELVVLAAGVPAVANVRRFLFHRRFPVDVRHNAKIHRLTLAKWAASAGGRAVLVDLSDERERA